jgi:histidinol-phosphate aminotransferase
MTHRARPLSVRPEIESFKAYSPGLSITEIKERFGLSSVVKLASNENPLGTSPLVVRTLERWSGSAFRYPQAGSPELRSALASYLGVSRSSLVAGNGSDEIIDLLLRIKPHPGLSNIVVFQPSFSIYRLQALLCGLEIRSVPLNDDFSFPFQALLNQVDRHTACVFLTNPDNPSGYSCSASEIGALAERLPEDCLLVVDEAYIEFVDDISERSLAGSAAASENIAVLRTFSKMYGLAGLRLGYAVLPEGLADMLLRVKLPFSVNLLAEQAGLAALQDHDFRQATRETVLQGRAFLQSELSRLKCRPHPSQANFILFSPPMPADRLFNQLLARGIIIRPLNSYGLTEHLRVSIGRMDENRLFIETLERILHSHDR